MNIKSNWCKLAQEVLVISWIFRPRAFCCSIACFWHAAALYHTWYTDRDVISSSALVLVHNVSLSEFCCQGMYHQQVWNNVTMILEPQECTPTVFSVHMLQVLLSFLRHIQSIDSYVMQTQHNMFSLWNGKCIIRATDCRRVGLCTFQFLNSL